MHYFTEELHLSRFRTSTKLAITAILLFSALGYLTNLALVYDRTGFTFKGTVAYYRGDQQEMKFPKSYPELLENLHFHLFSIPLILFILCHLFNLTSARERIKATVAFIAFSAAILVIASPWLIRYMSPAFARLAPLTGLSLTFVFGATIIGPLYEMWRKGPHRQQEDKKC